MKLTHIALENVLPTRSHQIGKLAEGLNLIEGECRTGKTAIRSFIRDVVLGNRRYVNPDFSTAANLPPQGSLTVQEREGEFRLRRNWTTGELEIAPLSGQPHTATSSVTSTLGTLDEALYDAVFNFSLTQGMESCSRLVHVLYKQFGVPVDEETEIGKNSFGNWHQEMESRRSRLTSLQQQIAVLKRDRHELISGRERHDSLRNGRLADLDREIRAILQQISESDLAAKHARIGQLEQEIVGLRLAIEDIVRHEQLSPPVLPKASLLDPYQLLYLRLDEIESQIRRWRRIQSDVQAQRVRLKDEMVAWGELTLDAKDHPYHNAKKLLVSLEERIDQTDHQARCWELAPVHQTDPSHTVREIQILCATMRKDLQSLSQELGQQYKTIRHRAAAAELKQLRHCYHVMNENIDRLVRRREQVLNEVRYLDPAGAEAIVRGDNGFLQCALHEGYWEARRRFVGPTPALVEPIAPSTSSDLADARMRLQNLQSELNQIHRSIVDGEANLSGLRARLAHLEHDRTIVLSEIQQFPARDMNALDAELSLRNAEYESLLKMIDSDRTYRQPASHPLLALAANHLQNVSAGKLQNVWLNANSRDLVSVTDEYFQVRTWEQLTKVEQNLVYLSLALAAKQDLASRGLEFPTIIDDAIVNFDRAQTRAIALLLGALEKQGHQIVLMANSSTFASEAFSCPRFRLPARSETIRTPAVPLKTDQTTSHRLGSAVPLRARSTNPDILHHWAAAGDIDPTTLRHMEGLYNPASDVNYPISKYAVASESVDLPEAEEFIVRYPSRNKSSGLAWESQPTRTRTSFANPISVDSIADPLAFAPSLDEATDLDRVEIFDAPRLRAFADLGIDTVGQLLALTPESMPAGLRESGIAAEQLNRWQALVWLLCTVPGLRVPDATLLVACGVTEPEHLATSHCHQLSERIQRYLASNEGQRLSIQSPNIDASRINGWIKALESTRTKWHLPNCLSRLAKRRVGSPAAAISPNYLRASSILDPVAFRPGPSPKYSPLNPSRESYPIAAEPMQANSTPSVRADLLPQREFREPFIARPPRMKTPEPRAKATAEPESVPSRPLRFAPSVQSAADNPVRGRDPNLISERSSEASASQIESLRPSRSDNGYSADNKLRFYLDLKDHIEAAPSIGPKTAERFERIGVRTVEDFLKQTSESMASKLKYKRITPDLIRSWQNQTRLVCRIPNLRGHDAQLLVACDLVEPEKIASMQPQRLLDIILPFARSKEGLKIVRTGKEPDLKEVSDWIKWASMTRSLYAA